MKRRWLTPVAALGGGLFLDKRTDVSVAYSLRRVASVYGGPLVRVRRSSDSTEQDFGSGAPAVNWADILAFIGAGSGLVAKLYDQSSNARDLAQSTAAAQPAISLLSNGLPGLLFDGVDDYMTTAVFALAVPFSFLTCMRLVTQNQTSFENFWTSSGADCGLYMNNASSSVSLYNGTEFLTNLTNMPVGTRGVIGGVMGNPAASRIDVNSAVIATATGDANANSNLGGLTAGGNFNQSATRFANMELQEHIMFNTLHSAVLSAADLASSRVAWKF